MFNALRKRRARMLITQVIDDWFTYIQNLAAGTQEYYKRTINDFFLNLPKNYISDVKSTDISLYLSRFSWHHKNSTTNKSLSALKSFFRFVSEMYNTPNITTNIKEYKEEMTYRPFISKENLDKILAKATQREKDVILMLAHTGMRCSELCGLKPENITPNLSSITIQGKGGKVRTIPCNQTVKEILSRSIHFPKNRKTVYNICMGAGTKMKVSLSPHMLRRYFASTLLAKGVSLLIISRLLGHSSVQTTEIYLGLSSSFLLGVTDVLD